jgi:hypothetical protein
MNVAGDTVRTPLRAVKVNANVWPVCDLKPETLPGISRPPCVDAARLIELVLSSNVNHLDLWLSSPAQVRPGRVTEQRRPTSFDAPAMTR